MISKGTVNDLGGMVLELILEAEVDEVMWSRDSTLIKVRLDDAYVSFWIGRKVTPPKWIKFVATVNTES